MEHLRRLYRVWNWLPAFRAVAETEHLPTASQILHVTPSALSRSIKQLEGELGQQLFRRVGRRLELSPAGQELLRALRESMGRLDRGLSAASTSQFVGPIRVSAQEPFASAFVLRALDALVEAHPLVVPNLSALAPATACGWVRDRRIDAAVLESPTPDDGLEIRRLGELRYSVYCGEGHDLFHEPAPPLERALRYLFVAPSTGSQDPWPHELDREVGMQVHDVHLCAAVCATGRFLALLPDTVALSAPSLRRLPLAIDARREVFAVVRAASVAGPVHAFLELAGEAFGA